MKTKALIILGLAALFGSFSPRGGIEGTFKGLTNDTLWIYVSELTEEGFFEHRGKDTVIVRNDRFFYSPGTERMAELTIYPLEYLGTTPNSEMISYDPGIKTTLLFSKEDRIRFDAEAEDGVISCRVAGNTYNEQLSGIHQNTLEAYRKRRDALKVINDKDFTGDKTPYEEQLGQAMDIIRNKDLTFILDHPDEPLSAYLLATYRDYGKIPLYAPEMGPNATHSVFGPMLRMMVAFQADSMPVIRAANRQKEQNREEMLGKPAPGFTLKDRHGNDFSLSDLQGRYVVLDFWGSWCWGCMESFPDLKTYYSRYPGQWEIVGISCHDTPERWRETLEKRELPWIHVIDDLQASVDKKYNVIAYPTYVLIDKNGILLDFPRQDTDVFRKLDSLRSAGLLE